MYNDPLLADRGSSSGDRISNSIAVSGYRIRVPRSESLRPPYIERVAADRAPVAVAFADGKDCIEGLHEGANCLEAGGFDEVVDFVLVPHDDLEGPQLVGASDPFGVGFLPAVAAVFRHVLLGLITLRLDRTEADLVQRQVDRVAKLIQFKRAARVYRVSQRLFRGGGHLGFLGFSGVQMSCLVAA